MGTSYERPAEGYIHGSNLILSVKKGSEVIPLGHAKSCKISNKSTTKERATKEVSNTGKWTETGVSKLEVTVSCDGFCFYGDQMGYDALLELWEKGEAVQLNYAHRGEEAAKYREGNFVIESLDEDSPADDDATYSISFKNSGAVQTKTA